ncbi:unnamed protein product [Adineta steineri]|uniref:G-protein coupled receptors family 1 profile domain-containing protein n=1 Tax=Adineta steineri TaxID=433720 RepID=A0A815I1R6_9BILA|nr:unnamed protein product [Adineta steineri]CAF1389536.1 unnamed protein product [Adineta steineri]CAF3743744.1 unnamed protein product [Adineta steineri]CAF3763734.1 unnamed protein product [Adineta steineri]
MSSSSTQYFQSILQNVTIYIGLSAVIGGFFGNILNIIIFSSLKTFRETSCALYLTVASTVNICHLLAALLSRVLIAGFMIDLTATSAILCKLRQCVGGIGPLISLTCMCAATIDQFLSMTIRWRHFSHRYTAWRLVIFALIFWCLYGILFLIYYDSVLSPTTGNRTCTITNAIFGHYFNQFHIPFLLGFIPLTIRIIFGLLAFISVRKLSHRQTPVVRLERDKQLTSMVLIQTLVDIVLSFPFFIYYTYSTYTPSLNPAVSVYSSMLIGVTNTIYYTTFSFGFYIYCCSSSRFRKQLIYVLFDVHLKYWCGINRHQNNNRVNVQQDENQMTSYKECNQT